MKEKNWDILWMRGNLKRKLKSKSALAGMNMNDYLDQLLENAKESYQET